MNDFYTKPTEVAAVTLARSSDLNDVNNATDDAFDILPDKDNINDGTINYAVDAGAVNAYVVTLPQTLTAYNDGLEVAFRTANANTGASTMNANSLGVKTIRLTGNGILQADDILANTAHILRYSTATGFFHLLNAVNSSAAAAASAAEAEASALAMDIRYLGAKSSAPSVDNQGNALTEGALYWNSVSDNMYAWTGSTWDLAYTPISDLLATQEAISLYF